MKKLKKLAVMAMLTIIAAGTGNMAVSADNGAEEPEFFLETDKAEYSGDESITETFRIQNTVQSSITGIKIQGSIPQGYKEDGEKTEGEKWNREIKEVKAGAEAEITVCLAKEKTKENQDPSVTEPPQKGKEPAKSVAPQGKGDSAKPGNKPFKNDSVKTGDSNQVSVWIVLVLVSLGVVAFCVKKKKGKGLLTFILIAAAAGSCLGGMETSVKAEERELAERTAEVTKRIWVNGEEMMLKVEIFYKVEKESENSTDLSLEGYTLKWEENFDGTELDRSNWNVELHNPGWVNAELQSYEDSAENIYVKDGELVLKAVKKVDESGDVSYTSGRINTQKKQDYKYGMFEAKIKVPEGKGFLPAFWMMPTDENLYGQWPKCGEIDIMEVLGDKTDTAHGTLHFGEPHTQDQGTYVLEEGDFSDEYHVFSCEWEPGKIRFYVDGRLYHTAQRWFSKKEGFGEVAYPAPYDQPFYMILNLAIGGSWVGYPDDSTAFDENAEMHVDYVRVYQKDSYDENVTKPDPEEVDLREPDASGNYCINGDFSSAEDLNDNKDWEFLLAGAGDAEAFITDNRICIKTKNPGDLDYSVQLVQAGLPIEYGKKYKFSFDAWAAQERTIFTGITAPDHNFGRYLQDTKAELKTEKSHYEYFFDMRSESDANGRIEFNLGNQGSAADVYITNVRLEQVGEAEVPDDKKTVLPDGNYVYNGAFQEGSSRMDYWEVQEGADAVVTNENNVRRLKVTAPVGTSADKPVLISQRELGMVGGTSYALSFTAEGDVNKHLGVQVAGESLEPARLIGQENNYTYKFTITEESRDRDLIFFIEEPGTFYLDNVRIVEDELIKNGSFDAGFAGYEFYKDQSADASAVVDSLKEANAADFTIGDTGDQAWKIQLKQNNVELEEGQWYRLTLDAKSSVERDIMFAIQRDGSADDNWDPYSGEKIVKLEQEYQSFRLEFQMTKPTDLRSILSISMGAVNGIRITEPHQIVIDNINLEKIDEPDEPDITPPVVPTPEEELIIQGDFSEDNGVWEKYIFDPEYGTMQITDGKFICEVKNPGTEEWHLQLKQHNLFLEKGAVYEVTMRIQSSASRTVKWALLSQSYEWYGGEELELTEEEEKQVCYTFTVDKESDPSIDFVLSMGKTGDIVPESVIEVDDISIIKK